MSEAWWLALAAALGLLGMAWLALAMEVHWAQAMQRPARPAARSRRALRALGVIALVAALLACLRADRPSMAVLVWVMTLTASAVAVALALASRPRWLALLAPWVRVVPVPGPVDGAGDRHRD